MTTSRVSGLNDFIRSSTNRDSYRASPSFSNQDGPPTPAAATFLRARFLNWFITSFLTARNNQGASFLGA